MRNTTLLYLLLLLVLILAVTGIYLEYSAPPPNGEYEAQKETANFADYAIIHPRGGDGCPRGWPRLPKQHTESFTRSLMRTDSWPTCRPAGVFPSAIFRRFRFGIDGGCYPRS